MNVSPWTTLSITASPSPIYVGQQSTVTAQFSYSVPNGIPVTFSFQGTPLGTLSTTTAVSNNNQATTTFTSDAVGTSHVLVADSNQPTQTVGPANIVINPLIPTTITVNSPTIYVGDPVTIIATVVRQDTLAPIQNAWVAVQILDTPYWWMGLTDVNGQIGNTITPTLLSRIYNIHADVTFPFDPQYAVSSTSPDGTLTVNKVPTSLTVDPASGYKEYPTTLTATLRDIAPGHGNAPVNGRTVNFYVNGVLVGSDVTGSDGNPDGVATWSYTIAQNAGTYSGYITASFAGDDMYITSNGANDLIVNLIPTSLVVNPAYGYKDYPTTLSATLRDTAPGHGNAPVSGQTVLFKIDGVDVDTATTDINGVATLPYTITQDVGTHTLVGIFLTDNTKYAGSNDGKVLTVNPISTSLSVSDVTGNKGETVDLKATLVDTVHGNVPVVGRKVTFKVNDVSVPGFGTTDSDGVAILPYTINLVGGTYNIEAAFAADDKYAAANGMGALKVPQSSVYVLTTVSNTNPTVGQIVTITFKLGNKGPDTAQKVVFTYVLPVGMELVNLSGDNTYSYNAATRTITWNLGDVKANTDPWLYANVRFLNPGSFNINPVVNTATYDPTLNSNIQSITVNAQAVPVTVRAVRTTGTAGIAGNGLQAATPAPTTAGATPYSYGTAPETGGNWLLSYWWIIILLLIVGGLLWFLLAGKRRQNEG
ncbi:hypothetical protein [Methanobacterium sp.]|uniref:hypothetical protein n=1 Tax=Methanobacterium sp. TaxID=2164 RepID=UPI003D650149